MIVMNNQGNYDDDDDDDDIIINIRYIYTELEIDW